LLRGDGRPQLHQEGTTMTTTLERALESETTVEQLLGTVGETMTNDVVLLSADMPAERAVRRLEYKAVSGAPVVDRGRVVGVVTRGDLLVPTLLDEPAGSPDGLLPAHGRRLAGLKVRDLMSDEPVTVQPDWSLVRAVRSMVDNGVSRVPVVDQNGIPLGILTRDDVLHAVVRRARPRPGSAVAL